MEKVVVNDCIYLSILNKQQESFFSAVCYRCFHFFVYNLLFTSPVCVTSSFVQSSSRSIELIVKQFVTYSAERKSLLYFFPGALNIKLVNSFILVWHSDYELSSKTQNPFFILTDLEQ